MNKYDNLRIKELAIRFPEILAVLKEYNIPCATCTKQNCFLKEVAENEELSLEQEIELTEKINKILEGKIL